MFRWCIITGLIILAFCGSFGLANLKVRTINGTQIEFEATQIIYRGNLSARIAENITSIVSKDISQSSGTVYITRSSLPNEKEVSIAEQNGALAVIIVSPIYHVAGYFRFRINDFQLATSISVPVFEVTVEVGRILWPLVTDSQIESIIITPDEMPNQWDPVIESGWMYVWTIVLCLYSANNIALALWKVIVFIKFYGGFKASVALFVLGIEMFANLIRFIGCIDAFGAFGLYPEWTAQMLMELTWPLAIASYMLFPLYWHEMMTNASLVVHPFLTKLRIPFFTLSSLLVALQIVRTIVRTAAQDVFNFTIITASVYLCAIVGLVLLYSITGVKLLKKLHVSRSSGRAITLGRTTTRILIGSGLLLSFVVYAILFVAGVPYRPVAFVVIWFVFVVLLNTSSIMNILAFQPPTGKSSGTSSKTRPGSTTSNPVNGQAASV